MVAAESAIPECLRTEVCPNCGYTLAGLPEPLTCPECGRIIDDSEIILYGWARGKHETLANTKTSRLAWVFIFPLLFPALYIPLFAMSINHSIYQFLLAVLVVILAMNGVLLARRKNTDHPAMIQVRVTSYGCIQFDRLAGPTPLLELWLTRGWIVCLLVILAAATAFFFHRIHAFGFATMSAYSALFGIPLALRSRRYRRSLARAHPRAIADRNAWLIAPLRWKNVADFTLEPRAENLYRLRMQRRGFWTTNPYPIDAEVRCTSEQAAYLHRRLQHLIGLPHNDPSGSQQTPFHFPRYHP